MSMDIAEVRRLNVVVHEDDDTITAVSPCPTADHRPEKVRPSYVVRFTCPHGESVGVFCDPCTANRRAGVWACLGRHDLPDREWGSCPGARVVEVATLQPKTIRKP